MGEHSNRKRANGSSESRNVQKGAGEGSIDPSSVGKQRPFSHEESRSYSLFGN